MASCNSSSNIRGQASIINPQGAYSRLFVNLDINNMNGNTIENGVTAGDVIRFSPTPFGSTGTYRKSQANNNENAEVIGVVESVSPSGIYTVVTHGFINLTGESIELKVNPITGSTQGASGGNDVYFLSPGTAGYVQNLEPVQATQIVKPILQRTYHPDYNYHVINYIGYAVAGDMIAENLSYVPVGSYTVVPDFVASQMIAERGYIDARTSQELDVDDYYEFYSVWSNEFQTELQNTGSRHYEVKLNQLAESAGSAAELAIIDAINDPDQTVILSLGLNCSSPEQFGIEGEIISVESIDETIESINYKYKIIVNKDSTRDNTYLPLSLTSFGIIRWGPNGNENCDQPASIWLTRDAKLIYYPTFPTPVITVNQTNIRNIFNSVTVGSTPITISYVPILKVKEWGAVNIPNILIADQVQATGTMSAESTFSLPKYSDVQTTIDDILIRLTAGGL